MLRIDTNTCVGLLIMKAELGDVPMVNLYDDSDSILLQALVRGRSTIIKIDMYLLSIKLSIETSQTWSKMLGAQI